MIFRALFGAKIIDPTVASTIRLRVYPNDLDSNFHMNNGRYLTVMDLGRLNLILRTPLLPVVWKKKYAPVLASAQVRFRVQMKCFQLFDLETRVLGWDEKWMYMEQRFLFAAGPKKGVVAAIGLLKGSFYDPGRKGTVPPDELLAVMNMPKASPDFPSYLRDWIAAEESLRAVTA